MHRMYSSIFYEVVLENMNRANRTHATQNSNNSLLAIILAAVHMAYQIGTELVYNAVYVKTHVYTIDNARLIVERPVRESKLLFPLSTRSQFSPPKSRIQTY